MQSLLLLTYFVYLGDIQDKNAAKRDSAGAVCNSGMGMLFCPALTKLALDLHVKKSVSVCLSFRSFFQGV